MTLFEAFQAFIMADTTLATNLSGPGKINRIAIPENPVPPLVVMKRVTGLSYSTLEGASGMCRFRMEITYWSSSPKDADQWIARFRSLVAKFNGLLGGTGGVKVSVHGTAGPRDVYDELSRYPGVQVDVLGIVDEDTVS